MLDLLFPKICLRCEKEGEYLCTNCFKKVIKIDPVNKCHVCNKESRIGFVHFECKEETYLDGLINLSVYDEIIKTLIYELKYNFYFDIANFWGKAMSQYFNYFNFKPVNSLLSYVPTSNKKLRKRGFNQSYLLAKSIGVNSDFKIVDLLIKDYNTNAQAKLDKVGRAENLKNTFILKESTGLEVEHLKNIIIVDDVFTTGATLNECAKVIKSKWPELKIFGFVIAKARG